MTQSKAFRSIGWLMGMLCLGCVSEFPTAQLVDASFDMPTPAPNDTNNVVFGQNDSNNTAVTMSGSTNADFGVSPPSRPDQANSGQTLDSGLARPTPSDSHLLDAGGLLPNDAHLNDLDSMSAPPMDPPMGGGPSDRPIERQLDMMVPPGPGGRQCQFDWPVQCNIDCNNEPGLNQLLHVRAGEERFFARPDQQLACVLIEGRLRVEAFALISTRQFILASGGTIDGAGRGNERRSPRTGQSGLSEYGRGGGGGGGSGACAGGGGAALDDGTNSVNGGEVQDHEDRPGGFGGRGGDRENLGGPGGAGGASLIIRANRCQLAGEINLSGRAGQRPVQSDGGGGGGGSSGQLTMECRRFSVAPNDVKIRLVGGDGGQGGAIAGYSGGGGGGGAGGQFVVRTDVVAIVNGGEIDLGDLLASMRMRVDTTGGAGGDHGPGGSDSERGEAGERCEFLVEDYPN